METPKMESNCIHTLCITKTKESSCTYIICISSIWNIYNRAVRRRNACLVGFAMLFHVGLRYDNENPLLSFCCPRCPIHLRLCLLFHQQYFSPAMWFNNNNNKQSNEASPLLAPSNASGNGGTANAKYYFLASPTGRRTEDGGQVVEGIPEGSHTDEFAPKQLPPMVSHIDRLREESQQAREKKKED